MRVKNQKGIDINTRKRFKDKVGVDGIVVRRAVVVYDLVDCAFFTKVMLSMIKVHIKIVFKIQLEKLLTMKT